MSPFENLTAMDPSPISSDTQSDRSNEKMANEKQPNDERDTNEVQAFEGRGNTDLEQNADKPEEEGLGRYESSVAGSRTISRRITGAQDLYDAANNTTEPLPPMGGGRDYPAPLPDRDSYLVSFNGPDDPLHPYNLPMAKKIVICGVVALGALSISMGSAMFSAAGAPVGKEYHVGRTVTTLGTSLFVFGFASGPIIWGPLSELFGRKIVMTFSSFGYVCFCFAVATSKDIQAIMITRFFAGFVGAAPLVTAPAVMADMFGAKTRGLAMSIFAMVLFGGPMIAPVLSAFIVKNSHMGWRWTQYMTGIIAAVAFLLIAFVLEETHHPLILAQKAETLRRRTRNWGIGAPHEEVKLDFREIVEKNISRPIVMLFTEPILFFITLYNAFIYGILYLFLTAIPLIFGGVYQFEAGVAELPYFGMFIGILVGGLICCYFEIRFNKMIDANGGKLVPEERLPSMMIGGFFFTIGLFWLGWTGAYGQHVHWIVPTIGAAFVGCGLITIFLPCINYIIDCYLFFAASALAGNTFLRSAFGAAFPLFAYQMFVNMKIQWAATLLGCFSLVLTPVPFIFYYYGKRLRDKSKYAFVL